MPDIRLKKVFDVSSRLFIVQGFSRTQIEQIARDAGISIGAMYDLFSGKRVILDFLIRCTIEPGFIETDQKLPLDASLSNGLEARVADVFENIQRRFEAPLEAGCPNYSYRQMLSDAFDVLSSYGTGCLLLESNPEVFGGLFSHYAGYRRRFYETVERFVRAFRAQGRLRAQPDARQAARYIVDSLFWWTMQIHYDIFEATEKISPAEAKEICNDALLHAYSVQDN